MRSLIFPLLLLNIALSTYAQDFEIIRHEVKMGETVKMISKKYKVLPGEIYKRNKFAVDGVRAGMVLQIAVEKKPITTESAVTKDEETTQQVLDENTISAVVADTSVNQITNENTTITHTIQKGDTLYGIARKYQISIEEIKSQNPDIVKQGFQIGQVVKITLPPNKL